VAAAEQGTEDEADFVPFPAYDQLDVRQQSFRQLGGGRELGAGLDVLPQDLVLQLGLRQDRD